LLLSSLPAVVLRLLPTQMIVMGLIVGSLFFSVPPDRTGVRMLLGASFICLMFLAFGSAPELGLLMMNRRCGPCYVLLVH
jgi:hypothetical protein